MTLRVVVAMVAVLLFGGIMGCSLLPTTEPEIQIEFWAVKEAVAPGECTELIWDVTGAEEYPVFLDGQEVDQSDREEVCPTETTTYELVVGAPGGPHRESTRIEVQSGAAATSPPAPPAAATATRPPAPPAATVTPPPPPPAAATQAPPPPPPPAATPTSPPPTPTPPPPTNTPFVPSWGSCAWVGVETAGINSHQPVTWCSNGSFLVGLDLDRQAIDPLDSPVIGQAQCCPLSAGQFSPWGQCSWVGVEQAGINSHQAVPWCPDGQYLTGLDLDRQEIDPLDSPVVGQGFCCPLGDPRYSGWSSCSWVQVEQAGINSHQPVTWCPNGSFLAGLDLDRQAIDPLDSPVVGQALCCSP